jgi:hypothetical protein
MPVSHSTWLVLSRMARTSRSTLGSRPVAAGEVRVLVLPGRNASTSHSSGAAGLIAGTAVLPSRSRPAARRARLARRGDAGRARICTQAYSPSRSCAPAASTARSGSASWSVLNGSHSAAVGDRCPPVAAAVPAGIGSAASAVVQAAPGHAPRTAASTAPWGTLPGTQIETSSCRPLQVYCHATCGVP